MFICSQKTPFMNSGTCRRCFCMYPISSVICVCCCSGDKKTTCVATGSWYCPGRGVPTIRRHDQTAHDHSQPYFLMSIQTHINTSITKTLTNPKCDTISWKWWGWACLNSMSPPSKHLSSPLLCSCGTWLTGDPCHLTASFKSSLKYF